jgi:integrase
VAKPEDLLFPDGKPNVRGQWGAKLGERFGQHLKGLGITGNKLSFHSFRHNWEDRLRAAGIHGTSLGKTLGGRKVEGSEAAYGQGFTIGDLRDGLEKVSYPGLDLSHLDLR